MSNIKKGFIDYYGSVWSDAMIAAYNNLNEQVEKREKLNPPPDSLSFKELEFYRDQRHRQFVINVELALKV